MPGSMMVTRAARRRRVGGLVLVAVVIGIAGGAVLTAAAGARRTASSLDRVRARAARQTSQATLVGAVGLVVGVPFGIGVGRAIWTAVADGIGAAPDVTVPWVAVGAAALVTLVVVNLIGAVGATSAVRERPAAVLAVE